MESPSSRLVAPGPPPASAAGPLYGARYDTAAPPTATATHRTLRPRSIPELLDGAVRLVRRSPGRYVGVGAAAVVLDTTVRAAVDAAIGTTIVSPDGTVGLRITPSIALAPVTAALLAGLLAVPTARACLGQAAPWGALLPQWRRLAGRLGAYVAVAAVVLLSLSALVWSGLGGRGAQQTDLFMALAALGLLLEVLRLPLLAAPAAIALEGAGPVRAIRRSWSLLRGSWGRAIGVTLAGRVVVVLVTGVLALPLSLLAPLLGQVVGVDLADSVLGPPLRVLLVLLAACLTLPFEAALRDLFYIDLRVRREGLDVALAGGPGGDR